MDYVRHLIDIVTEHSLPPNCQNFIQLSRDLTNGSLKPHQVTMANIKVRGDAFQSETIIPLHPTPVA